jgi:hypothetical protein
MPMVDMSMVSLRKVKLWKTMQEDTLSRHAASVPSLPSHLVLTTLDVQGASHVSF